MQISFPAMEGVIGGRKYYSCLMKLSTVPKMFTFRDWAELLPEHREQRVLNKRRVPEIARYILDNEDGYLFASITASYKCDVDFTPSAPGGSIGELRMQFEDANFVINDGQHRCAGIAAAIRENPAVGDKTISVLLFPYENIGRVQQMFSDLNRYVAKTSKSLDILYDKRDQNSRVSLAVVEKVPVFIGLVDKDAVSLPVRSPKLFTLSSIYDATNKLLGENEETTFNDGVSRAIDYWTAVSKMIPLWGRVKSGEMKSVDMRQEFICAHSVVLRALGSVGADLFHHFPNNWKEKLIELNGIDWRKVNPDWENVCIVANSVVSNRQARLATKAYLKRRLGLELTEPEKRSLPAAAPRTLEEAVVRSEQFAMLRQKDRRAVKRVCDFGTRLISYRTGNPEAFAPSRDDAWKIDFIGRHPRLLDSVKHIHEKNANKAIGKYVSPGYASGLLYLMGSGRSDAEEYLAEEPRTEDALDWDLWDRGCEFWSLLAAGAVALKPVRAALENLAEPTLAEKIAIVAKAWALFREGKKITDGDLELEYDTEDDVKRLAEHPTLGGIDQGDPEEEEAPIDESEVVEAD